jgi:hypothetical protein
MLFIRRYRESVGRNGFLGGDVKLFQYASHVVSSELFDVVLFVAHKNAEYYDALIPPGMRRTDRLAQADAYFLAGLDWSVLDRAGIDTTGRPAVNLIQGFVHLMPGDPRRDFFSRPALRICVSAPLRDAVASSGLANGPLLAIENGTDVPIHAAPKADARSVFVAGLKNLPLAREIADTLARAGLNVSLQTHSLPRSAFLDRLRDAGIAVVLPLPHEGFFLPALEAMALGCAVVIPFCEGTRSFCLPDRTALVTEYTADALTTAVLRLHAEPALVERLRRNGFEVAERHSLEGERSVFLFALRSYLARGSYGS